MSMDITKARVPLPVHADLFTWMAVHGNLCLALRHPSNVGGSRQIVEEFVRALGARLVEEGLLSADELRDAEKLERQEGGLNASRRSLGEDS